MTAFDERAFVFPCAGEDLVGIVSVPSEQVHAVGLLLIVGGPQYRAGSHRLFVTLARGLAARGIACMRFDHRGLGDATGESRSFTDIGEDIRAAVDAFFTAVPSLSRVALCGLCDGASAACLYAGGDDRLAGLVLINPWVHTEAGEAKTLLKHYYLKRLVDPSFWRNVWSGRLRLGVTARELLRSIRRALPGAAREVSRDDSLPARMAQGVLRSGRPFAVVLSGRDHVAREFADVALARRDWATAVERLLLARADIDAADHTLSRTEWVDELTRQTAVCLERLEREQFPASP